VEEAHGSESEDTFGAKTVLSDDEGIKEPGRASGDPSLSKEDEALSDSSASSYGDSSDFAAAANLGKLLQLIGSSHYYRPCCITKKDGVKTPSICGRKTQECQQHAKHCVKGEDTATQKELIVLLWYLWFPLTWFHRRSLLHQRPDQRVGA
jgi:hypothetical protein